MAGAQLLALYSMVFVLGSGSLTLTIYVASLLRKVVALLTVLLCPLCVTRCRKRMGAIPQDFEHFVGEFDFEVDLEDAPQVWPTRTPCKTELKMEVELSSLGPVADLEVGDAVSHNGEVDERLSLV